MSTIYLFLLKVHVQFARCFHFCLLVSLIVLPKIIKVKYLEEYFAKVCNKFSPFHVYITGRLINHPIRWIKRIMSIFSFFLIFAVRILYSVLLTRKLIALGTKSINFQRNGIWMRMKSHTS